MAAETESINTRLKKLEIASAIKNDKPKKFIFPKKFNGKMNKKKASNQIVVWMLNMHGVWEEPFISPIVSGDIIVKPNLKAYHIDPTHITRYGKWLFYVGREIDKELVPANGQPSEGNTGEEIEPISNADYDEVVKRGRSTSNHPTILKAVLAARQEAIKPKGKINGKIILIVIGVLVVLGVIIASVMNAKPAA